MLQDSPSKTTNKAMQRRSMRKDTAADTHLREFGCYLHIAKNAAAKKANTIKERNKTTKKEHKQLTK